MAMSNAFTNTNMEEDVGGAGHILIQYPKNECSRCRTPLSLRNEGGGRHRDGREMRVATDIGVMKGIEIVKQCGSCHLKHYVNFTEEVIFDDDGTKIKQR